MPGLASSRNRSVLLVSGLARFVPRMHALPILENLGIVSVKTVNSMKSCVDAGIRNWIVFLFSERLILDYLRNNFK